MDTRKIASEYRLSQWAQMLQARQSSQQSINEFCKSMGVSRNTYFYWQRKVRKAACALGEYKPEANLASLTSTGFAEVKVKGNSDSAQSSVTPPPSQLHIEAAGARITVDSEYQLRNWLYCCGSFYSHVESKWQAGVPSLRRYGYAQEYQRSHGDSGRRLQTRSIHRSAVRVLQ